jgi:hypothetical protein
MTLPVINYDFALGKIKIPAGAENFPIEASYTFGFDAQLIEFMPHMHLRGKDFTYEAIYPDGKRVTLLSVPRYQFAWQTLYQAAEPIPMPRGTKLRCIAHFDNSAKNPNNPNPNKDVGWGDQTWEEMMVGWVDYCVPVK